MSNISQRKSAASHRLDDEARSRRNVASWRLSDLITTTSTKATTTNGTKGSLCNNNDNDECTRRTVADLGHLLDEIDMDEDDCRRMEMVELLLGDHSREILLILISKAGLFDHIYRWLDRHVRFIEIRNPEVSYKLISNILAILKKLPLSASNLRANSTGRLVKKLTKLRGNCPQNVEIRKSSEELINDWKKLIKKNNKMIENKNLITQNIKQSTQSIENMAKYPKIYDEELIIRSLLLNDNSMMIWPLNSLSNKNQQDRRCVKFIEGDGSVLEYLFVPLDFEEVPSLRVRNVDDMRRQEQSQDLTINLQNINSYIEWYKPIKIKESSRNNVFVNSPEKLKQENIIKNTLRNLNLYSETESPSEPDSVIGNEQPHQLNAYRQSINENGCYQQFDKFDYDVSKGIPEIPLATDRREQYILFHGIQTQHRDYVQSSAAAKRPHDQIGNFTIPMVFHYAKPITSNHNISEFYHHMAGNLVAKPSSPQKIHPSCQSVPPYVPHEPTTGPMTGPIDFPPIHHIKQRCVPHHTSSSMIPCNHFFTKGWCKFRDRCIFSHVSKFHQDKQAQFQTNQ